MPTGGYQCPTAPISRTLVCRRPNSCGAAAETIRTGVSTHTRQHARSSNGAASAAAETRRRRNRPDDAGLSTVQLLHTKCARPTPASPRHGCYTQTRATANARRRDRPHADAPASDPASWRNWTPVSPYLAKDPRPDLSQGMSLKAVEEIEARAQEAQKYALEAESLSQQAQQASQEALAAIERKDRETVTEKCKEAERLAAEAKEVEEKCKAAYDACKKAREDARAMADAGDAEE